MALLNRFLIRIGLLLSIIILVVSLSFIGILINSAQETIGAIEDQRAEHNQLDNQIIQANEIAILTLERLISQNLQRILLNDYGFEGTNETGLQPADFQSRIFDARDGLIQRENNLYNMSQIQTSLFNYQTLGLELPDFSTIINLDSETGALGLLNDFAQSSTIGLAQVASNFEDANRARRIYDNRRGTMQNDTSIFLDSFSNYSTAIDQFYDDLLTMSNETLALTIINETRQLEAIVADVNDLWSNYTYVAFTEIISLELTSSTAEEVKDTYLAQFYQQMSVLDNYTSHPDVFVTYDNSLTSINNTLTSFFLGENQNGDLVDSALTRAIDNLYDMFDQATLINEIFSVSLADLQIQVENSLEQVRVKIAEENDEFLTASDVYIQQVRDRLSIISGAVFTSVIVFVTFTLFVIFLFITSGLTRVLKKNRALASGVLNIPSSRGSAVTEFGILDSSVDQLIARLRDVLSRVQQTAETLAGISEELAAGAEESVASINDVASTIREFSAGSSEQNLLISRVRNNLIEHQRVVENTSNQIQETASFVQRVAKQTNILGLNASIEAAKAGRFGLGFNVVAEEVRKLSDETTESAARIQSSIETIDFNIRRTVDEVMNEVSIIGEVAENTAAGSEEANASASEQVIMLNEISDTSNQLSELSQELNEIMKSFEL